MNNKEIQEQRMKGYFMQATKELLKGEGLKSINVRSIAQQAGYSYATMYNYFKDVKELVFLCVEDFQEECEAEIKAKTKKLPRGREKIKAITRGYIDYFVQYPSVFNLFFVERLGDIGQKQPTASLIYTFLDRLCADEWDYCSVELKVDEKEVARMKQQLNFVCCGMLLYYMNRMQPSDYREFISDVALHVDSILSAITTDNVK